VPDQKKKTARVVYIPDNLPKHLFQADEDEKDESAKCIGCGLTLASFLSDPYPRYDRLRLENFRRAKNAWVQLQSHAPAVLSKPTNIHTLTENSKWAVYTYEGSRPIHFFLTEEEAIYFLNSYSRASFEIFGTKCQHRISENSDPSEAPQLVLGGTKYSGDGWQNPVPVVPIDTGHSAISEIESLTEYFASIGKIRNLEQLDQRAHVGIQVDDACNGNLEPIRCWLDKNWKFSEIVADASGLRGHQVEDIQISQPYDALIGVARDLDIALCQRPRLLTPVNTARFWTSLQVFRYFESFGYEKLGRASSHEVEKAWTFLRRRLASYANGIMMADAAARVRPLSGVSAEPNIGTPSNLSVLEISISDQVQPVESKLGKKARAASSTGSIGGALKAHRLRILKEYKANREITTIDILARNLGVSPSALYGMARQDRNKYSEERLRMVLKKIGCSHEKWNRTSRRSRRK
jgi:hypothetical protein